MAGPTNMGDMFDVTGRVALVTGASSGLGRRFASVLAHAGARVVLAARSLDHLETVAAAIEAEGGAACPVSMDVTSAPSIAAGFDRAESSFGTVEILVNNAGVATSNRAMDLDEADWDLVVGTNLKGAWLVAQEAARRMAESQRGGSIINIASVTALRVARGLAHYGASKAGLVHLTGSLAYEWAKHDIRVNAIAPGYILTEMNAEFFASPAGLDLIGRIPQQRVGRPEDLDGTLILLASDASRYMSGSVVSVDGGHRHAPI